MDFHPLDTPRLRLVPLDVADAEALLPLYSDAETMGLYLKEPCVDVEGARAVVERMLAGQREGTGIRWTMRERQGGAVVGTLGFHGWDRERRAARLAYELLPAWRGRGLADEGVRAVLAFAFRKMGVDQVEADVLPYNLGSIRVLERLRFDPWGTVQRTVWGTTSVCLRYVLQRERRPVSRREKAPATLRGRNDGNQPGAGDVASKGRGYRTFERDGFQILVGKGARENDRLTFGIAEPADLWLHASGFAGSHVVIRNPDRLPAVPREVVECAAQLAAWHSKARDARGKVDVHLCRASDVRKPRGFAPGKVEIRKWESVKVYSRNPFPDEPEEAAES